MSGHKTPSKVGRGPPRQPMKRPAYPSHGDPGPSKRVSYYIKDSENPKARLSDTEPSDVFVGTDTASNNSQRGRTFGAEATLEYDGAVLSGTRRTVCFACSALWFFSFSPRISLFFDAFPTVLVPP